MSCAMHEVGGVLRPPSLPPHPYTPGPGRVRVQEQAPSAMPWPGHWGVHVLLVQGLRRLWQSWP